MFSLFFTTDGSEVTLNELDVFMERGQVELTGNSESGDVL